MGILRVEARAERRQSDVRGPAFFLVGAIGLITVAWSRMSEATVWLFGVSAGILALGVWLSRRPLLREEMLSVGDDGVRFAGELVAPRARIVGGAVLAPKDGRRGRAWLLLTVRRSWIGVRTLLFVVPSATRAATVLEAAGVGEGARFEASFGRTVTLRELVLIVLTIGTPIALLASFIDSNACSAVVLAVRQTVRHDVMPLAGVIAVLGTAVHGVLSVLHVTAGVDGVRTRTVWGDRFVPYESFVRVVDEPRVLTVHATGQGRAGRRASPPIAAYRAPSVFRIFELQSLAQEHVVGRILARRETVAPALDAHVGLQRGRRTVREWLESLRALAPRGVTGYRDAEANAEALMVMVESSVRSLPIRGAAAVALKLAGDPAHMERLRAFARATANRSLEKLLLDVVAAEDDAALVDVLLDLEDIELRQR